MYLFACVCESWLSACTLNLLVERLQELMCTHVCRLQARRTAGADVSVCVCLLDRQTEKTTRYTLYVSALPAA